MKSFLTLALAVAGAVADHDPGLIIADHDPGLRVADHDPGLRVADHDPGLRVKFNIGLKPGTDFFFNVPRSIAQAVIDRWKLTPRPGGHLPSLSLYCHADLTMCVLFDDTGKAAGLQIALDQTEFKDNPYDMKDTGFTEWEVTTNNGQVRKFWTIAVYFVSKNYLRLPAATREATRNSSKLLQEDAVWVTGFHGEIDKISAKESDIQKSIFTRQACIPWMGRHYYYDMRKDTECRADTMYPWFPLTDNGNIVGLGMSVIGKYPIKPRQRDWFEHPPRLAVKVIVPRGPDCLYDLATNPGITTMHIYFINRPSGVGCSPFNN